MHGIDGFVLKSSEPWRIPPVISANMNTIREGGGVDGCLGNG